MSGELFAPGAVVDYVGENERHQVRSPYRVVDPNTYPSRAIQTDSRIASRNFVVDERGIHWWFLPEELRLLEYPPIAEDTFTVTRADLEQIRDGLGNHETRTEVGRLVADLLEPPVTRTFLVELVVPPDFTVTTNWLEQRLRAMHSDVRSVKVEEQL